MPIASSPPLVPLHACHVPHAIRLQAIAVMFRLHSQELHLVVQTVISKQSGKIMFISNADVPHSLPICETLFLETGSELNVFGGNLSVAPSQSKKLRTLSPFVFIHDAVVSMVTEFGGWICTVLITGVNFVLLLCRH